jgi:hypothetical protein
MKLFQITSPSIGNSVITVKADSPKHASEVARDVIEENRMTDDSPYTLHIVELVPPEDNEAGYCYPKTPAHTINI